MTRPRNDGHSTEFGLWLRCQDEISSSRGYIATNLDFIWSNYKSGLWMLIEEKRFNSQMRWSQERQFQLIDFACRFHPKYRGFHLVVFEKSSPDDGRIWLDKHEISRRQLMEFLAFNKPDNWYRGYFAQKK